MLQFLKQKAAQGRYRRLERKLNRCMDIIWEEEGRQLQEEQRLLEQDPDFRVPPGYGRRVTQAIRGEPVQQEPAATVTQLFPDRPPERTAADGRVRPVRTKQVLRKVGMIALLAVLVLGVLMVSSGAMRQWLARLVVQDTDVAALAGLEEHALLDYSDVDLRQTAWLPLWVPKGYEIYRFSQRENGEVQVEYRDASNQRIYYWLTTDTSRNYIDNEDADSIEPRQIQSWLGTLYRKGDRGTLHWFDEEKAVFMRVTLYAYDEDVMDRIVASIELVTP